MPSQVTLLGPAMDLAIFFRGLTPPPTAALQGPTMSHCEWPAWFRLNLTVWFNELQLIDVPSEVTFLGPAVYLEAFCRGSTTAFERPMMS